MGTSEMSNYDLVSIAIKYKIISIGKLINISCQLQGLPLPKKCKHKTNNKKQTRWGIVSFILFLT